MNYSPNDRESPLAPFPGQPTRLYDRVAEALRTVHHFRRTERAHSYWIRHFICLHDRLQVRYDIRTVHELVGHKYFKTTMVDTNVTNCGGQGSTVPSTGCEMGSPSTAGELCEPRPPPTILEVNYRMRWSSLHGRQL